MIPVLIAGCCCCCGNYVDRCRLPYNQLLIVVSAAVHSQLSEGPLVRNVVVQIPKFDTKPNPNSNPNPNHIAIAIALTLCLYDNWNLGQLGGHLSCGTLICAWFTVMKGIFL